MPRIRVTNGRAVTALREDLGILQKDLAERIGVSASYLSRIESGVETPGPTATVRALAAALGATLDQITIQLPDPAISAPEPVTV